ncbi:MAG: hypothetical protein U0Y68_20540 [Blastocatellia bacterium]
MLAQDDGSVDERMMYLSSTLLAAPLVSGTVALMLQANANPNTQFEQKAILTYSAQPLKKLQYARTGARGN